MSPTPKVSDSVPQNATLNQAPLSTAPQTLTQTGPQRVLCCSGSLEGGGSERQLWQLATGLDAARFSAEIFVLYRQGLFLSQVPSRIPVHDFWSAHGSQHFPWPGQIRRRQIRHLKRVILERNIALVYDRTFHMTLLTAAACRSLAKPRVSVIVSPPSRDFVRSPERFRWLKKRLLAAAYRDPLCWPVAVSSSVADDAARFYGVPRNRFETIPSPIDIAAVERGSEEKIDECEQLAQQTASLKIVVVGRLSSEKGQSLAIEAITRIKSARPSLSICLTIVGDGPDRQSLEQLVQRLSLENCVHFTGRVVNPYPWIRASDLLCIPSYYEGLPNVALEALCLGTPLLATECSGALAELLGNNQRGVLTPVQNADALASAILDRIDAPQVWRARATDGQAWVRAHHGLQPWLQRMQQLFEQRINHGKLA